MGVFTLQAAHLRTKVPDVSVILRVVLMMIGNGYSLRTAVAVAHASGLLSICAVALHRWMRKLGDYLAWWGMATRRGFAV